MQDEIRYSVIYSRRRTIGLIVSPDKGVVVRAPYRTSVASIHGFVKEKEGWIRKHLEKYSGLIRLNSGKRYEDGELYLLKGKEYRLRLIESKQASVTVQNNMIVAALNDISDKARIRHLISRFYLIEAREFLSEKYNEIIGRYRYMGFNPSGLVVKTIRSRWGSCSSRGKITLSTELVKLDPAFSEYVIIHELCHLKHHNHGKEYYRLLGELAPGYKAVRRDLRQYITK